jgi:lysozyme family protein
MASYDSAIPYIQKAEGGLSRATTDTASQKPAPFTFKGKTGWHTNRGITWETFSSLAPSLGYQATAENFFNMPDSIWLLIYKEGYWKPMRGELYDSQAIANAVVDFAWAGGVGGATSALIKYLASKGIKADGVITVSQGLNQLTKKDGEAKAFNDIIDYRKAWFKSLKQPANEAGWLSRMETLRAGGLLLLDKAKKRDY